MITDSIIVNDNLKREGAVVEVFLSNDNSVYIKFSNFDSEEQAEDYANYLAEVVPLIFYESETVH